MGPRIRRSGNPAENSQSIVSFQEGIMPAQYPMHVEQHHKLMYANSVQMVAQQMRNPILAAATMVPASGEAMSVRDLFGKVKYMRGEARTRRNRENPVSGSRRWLVYEADNEIMSSQYIDFEDKFKTATDPTSKIVTSHTIAVTQGQMDQLLGIEEVSEGLFQIARGGLYGIAREGKTPNSGTALPSAQYLPSDSQGLNVEKLIEAVKTLKKADFGIDNQMDPLFGLITPTQEADLLRVAAATGTSLNAFDLDQLQSGKPTMLMGVNWIMSNRVPVGKTGAAGAGKRLCAIWSKSNLIGGEWWGITGKMWNDTSADDKPFVKVSTNLDAVRAEDKGVVIIPCTED
jgi:hypothetical protein